MYVYHKGVSISTNFQTFYKQFRSSLPDISPIYHQPISTMTTLLRCHLLINQPLSNPTKPGIPIILQIVTPRQPRPPIPSLGHLLQRTLLLQIRTAKIHNLQLLHALPAILANPRYHARHAAGSHVAQDATDQQRARIRAQRPARIRVAHQEEGVGQVLHHGGFPEELVAGPHDGAVHGDLGAAGEEHLEPRRRDDHVGLEFLARRQDDAPGGHGLDRVGDDGASAGAQGGEEVAVRAHAEALSPRVVGRLEMGVVWDRGGELFYGRFLDGCSGESGVGHAPLDDEDALEDVLPAV